MLIKPAAIEDAGDDDNCPKTGMCKMIRSPIFHGNEASGGALPCRGTLGKENDAVVCPTTS